MSSQPPSSLPSGLHNTSPLTFAAFKFSPNFGGPRAQTDQNLERPRTLAQRMVFGSRVVPFKPTGTPLAGPSSPSKVKSPATLDTDMLDTSDDGGKQPQTSPLPAPSVDIPPLSSAAGVSSQEKNPPPDIWEHAQLVQNEWASVERPSLPSVIHRAMGAVTLEDNTMKGTQGPQKMTKTSTPHPKNEHTSLPIGLAPRGLPPPSVSSSRGPEKFKKEEDEIKVKQEDEVKVKQEEVKVKHERLEASLPRSNAPVFVSQRQSKSEPSSTLAADVPVKKEEISDQYFGAAAQRVQPFTRVNVPPNPVFVSKKVEERAVDLPQAEKTFENHHVVRENGTLNHARSDMKPASPPTKEFDAEETTNRTGRKPPVAGTNNARATVDVNSPSSRAHYTPLQSSSISKPILPIRASPPLVQTSNRQGNEPTRTYQGNTPREPASVQASDPRLKPSSGPIAPLVHRNSTFESTRDASDERGRAFMRSGLSTLPTRPNDSTEGYRRYSPRRGSSPPRHSDRSVEDRPITRTPPRVDRIRPPRRYSPHTPPRRHLPHTPPPRTYPLPTLPRSRSPLRRTSDAYNRQNERAGDSYRPSRSRSRSRSRSPRRRWAEREYPRDQLSPRGLWNGDMKRGSTVTYPAHNIRPRSEWRTTTNSNAPEPYRRKFEDPYLIRSPEGAYDSYRPTQPIPSRQPARNGSDSYRPRRGSPGSDRQSPMSVEWEEPATPAGGNARRALSRVVSDPETSHRSSSIGGDVPLPMQMEPYQGLKRRRAEEEPQAELAKRSPVSGPERAAKRRRIDETDVEMDASLANPGNSGGVLESAPPTNASLIASVPVTQPPNLEEYPSHPTLIPTGNKLLMRMYGPKPAQLVSSTRKPTALTTNPSDDPDDALRHQNMRGAPTSSLTTHDAMDSTNPPAIARVSLKDRIHRPQPTHTDSTLPSSSNTPTENLGKPPSRRASGSGHAPPQHANISEIDQSAVGLLGRIDLNQTSVSQFGNHVVEVPDLRGSRQPQLRVPSGNDQDISQPLQARVGLRADDAAPQRPRQGSKGGRGGNLAARLD